jgi:hypothetical protein
MSVSFPCKRVLGLGVIPANAGIQKKAKISKTEQ